MGRLAKIVTFAALSLAGWIAFESFVSWAAFCNHPEQYGAAYQSTEEYSCVFRGPFISLSRAFGVWWGRVFDKPDAYVALFTGVLAVSTAALWYSTQRLWRAGEIHSERELRAYITGATKAEICGFDSPNPVSCLEFQNSGQTPAHNVRFWTSSAVAAYPLANPPLAPTGEFSEQEGSSVGTIGPGVPFYAETKSDVAVSDADRAGVIEGNAAFFLYGEMFYRDAFGRDRHTTFCYYYRGDRARSARGPLASYHKWNKAT
jgi:hypothetical protein